MALHHCKTIFFVIGSWQERPQMFFENVSILSLACVDATHRVTSAAIEERIAPSMKRFDIQKGLLENLTGIVARRFWDEGMQPSQAATLAARKAIEASGLDKKKLGVLISTSVCKDYIEPSVACLIHGNLGLSSDCLNFDVGNACLAFLNGMQIIANMIERRQLDYGLVVDGESCRMVIEKTIQRVLAEEKSPLVFRNNFATFTLGSGAVAMILTRSELAPDRPTLRGGVTVAATEHNRLCIGQPDEMITDAKALLVAGVELAARTLDKANKAIGWDFHHLDQYIVHQVSRANTEKLCQKLKMDQSRVFTIFEEFGNIGPAALPITLAKAVEAGRVKPGHKIALMGIGSGLNCSMMEVDW
jgi:3-oxoacyl-[acyl-carrier-protein] synthase-3